MRKFRFSLSGFVAALALVCAAPAFAQEAPAENLLEGDHITVGVGGFYGPSYDGSDENVLSPYPGVMGRIGGIYISPRPSGLALDLIPEDKGARFGVSLGPVGSITFNRNANIKDPVVRAAGKLDVAVELGVNAGVVAYKLLHDYDSLSLSVDVKWDVAGAYSGMTWAPSINYVSPVSKAVLVGIYAGAHHADGNYARYYYSVTPAQSAASGLPEYRAKAGWDSVNAGLLVGWDLSGDLRDGGFALFAMGSYARMLNDGKDTPYTALRGDADQWTGGLGVAYTF
ncbi:MipA/OmpV family protein [Novosphingobium mangrovi (ex Huang et al. 2023)]|uniref:MipA/OmpV family protein n=1 Tax=Novosphingobium mangrovi (ex Huang et al. 2023) TaxID=2976432 RepID=A0ABT2HZR5_9SPHN|nr:MipA/OmpV family protein [Novosphingobium mangrovi (ex Huang et al. 2023)]MCT2398046.1 MipA/OmpV family protein [Novosphingobium mangrovi (ex Huang et al. 2023)]